MKGEEEGRERGEKEEGMKGEEEGGGQGEKEERKERPRAEECSQDDDEERQLREDAFSMNPQMVDELLPEPVHTPALNPKP